MCHRRCRENCGSEQYAGRHRNRANDIDTDRGGDGSNVCNSDDGVDYNDGDFDHVAVVTDPLLQFLNTPRPSSPPPQS